jgi:muconolactone D-isomerase
MLYFFKVRVLHEQLTVDELWDAWEREAETAQGAVQAGLIRSIYKVVGQRRVIGILDLDTHDQMDQILMSGLPMAHVLEWEEVVPVREYADFADDVKRRWKLPSPRPLAWRQPVLTGRRTCRSPR